jgi:23S rRNA pseudouridine1911/1915/1917 synthase
MEGAEALLKFSEDGTNILHTVGALAAPMRISEYLKNELHLSVTLIKRVKYGGVFLNGENVHMRASVKEGDRIEIALPEEKSEGIPPIDLPLEVLYEDEQLLAVCKPKNMPTHPSRGNSLPTLANAIMAREGEGFVFRAVNRLDRDTSGIVLIARDAFTAAKMAEDMKAGRYEKTYLALVEGVPESHFGIIDAPIERVAPDSIKRCVREDGKAAITEYEVIGVRPDGALLRVSPKTGRTHQIRVHLSHIGHALVGDFLYGEKTESGYLLHCSEIKLPHPITRNTFSVKSPLEL